jgi:hypothetical protein
MQEHSKVNNVFSQKNLVLGLIALLSLKFLIIPMFDWQADMLGELKAKKVQLSKMSSIVVSRDDDMALLSRLKTDIETSRRYFYSDNSSLELDIQRDIEEMFSAHSLEITQFKWVSDNTAIIRSIRARINFRGSVRQMIGVFWDLARAPKAIKQVEWHQKVNTESQDDTQIGPTFGHIVLEFYAMPLATDIPISTSLGALEVE